MFRFLSLYERQYSGTVVSRVAHVEEKGTPDNPNLRYHVSQEDTGLSDLSDETEGSQPPHYNLWSINQALFLLKMYY